MNKDILQMNILCVIDDLGSGGAQRQLVGLAKGFKKKGYQVCFLTYHPNNYFKCIIDASDINLHCIEEKNYLKRFFKMRSFIKKNDFQVVISFLESANFICEFSSIFNKRWTLIVGERSANPNIYKSIKLKTYRWAHLFADYIVANSYANLKIVKKICPILPQEKCKVIYNAIDISNLNNIASKFQTYSYRKNGKLEIVVASSHQRIKNLNNLIEAVNILDTKEKNNILINWYGDVRKDDSLEDAKKKIQEYDLIHNFNFYPATHDIFHKMLDADFIGLFSMYEGLPNAICEGMALGKPILATAISDNSIFIEESINGFLSDPKSPIDIANSLKKALKLNKEEVLAMGVENKIKAKLLFNKTEIVNQYESLFNHHKKSH